nr:PREDICTED: nephrocystin-1-like [Latimeria chalumnae]|eukprot:XP_006013673.1 PREDICTED: nephrocystin-1-like [Latimeria chalumnae]
MEQTDIMDALRSVWAEQEGALKRSEKRDKELLKSLFIKVYHDSAYVLLHSTLLPAAKWADEETEGLRWRIIAEFLRQSREKESSLFTLLSPETATQPFDVSQTTYDFLTAARKTPLTT